MKFTVAIILSAIAAEAQDWRRDFPLYQGRNEGRSLAVCMSDTPPASYFEDLGNILDTTSSGEDLIAAIELSYKYTIGSSTACIPEAADAGETGAMVADGESGDTDFPHGNLKPIATVGEISTCADSSGERIVGVPDGLGAYLIDDETVRVIVQSESYGPLRYESYAFPVNDGNATFTGSHIQYVDYGRSELATFMNHDGPASDFVKGFGEVITTSYNLKGELVGPRNVDGLTTVGAHFSNTDVMGNYSVAEMVTVGDWLMQSLCSAHLVEKYQWANGIGLEDDVFITNEEWMTYSPGADFVGISSHAIDLATGTDYAVGAMTNGGFEKIIEINPQHKDLVMFSPSGYNGAFDNFEKELADRIAEYPHPDGGEWVWTKDIVPARIYIGVKGLDEMGNPADDFLSRNGLRFGQLYGFSVSKDMMDRDEWHQGNMNGAMVEGKWLPIDWRWDGVVRDFSHDGAWHFQIDPPTGGGEYKFWNANGNGAAGAKMEHNSPDPRDGYTGFAQTSTAGYFGMYQMTSDVSSWAIGDNFPTELEGVYYLYQGETDIRSQVELGGKGQYRDGYDATVNYSKTNSNGITRPTNTLEDPDGFELIWDGESLRAIIQEDSGNYYGDRMFITSPLEHEDDGEELTYYFIAMSGGKYNTRMVAGVGIPEGTNVEASSHEFSGIFDMSGLLETRNNGVDFRLTADQFGWNKRSADARVAFNDKYILIGLQAHNLYGGIIETFQCDRGGQWLIYQPDL